MLQTSEEFLFRWRSELKIRAGYHDRNITKKWVGTGGKVDEGRENG